MSTHMQTKKDQRIHETVSRIGLIILGTIIGVGAVYIILHPRQQVTDPQHSPATVSLTTYTDTTLGFSVDIPATVTVTDCSRHTEDGFAYVMPDQQVTAPLIHTEIPNGVIFHPEWYVEAFGLTHEHYLADCRKADVTGSALAQRDVPRDFPYWTVLSDAVKSETDMARSVARRCTSKSATPALFLGLATTTVSGVLEVQIGADLTKTEDQSSPVFCPDLLYAKYVPATKRVYYLFNNGQYHDGDPTPQAIQDTLRFQDAVTP